MRLRAVLLAMLLVALATDGTADPLPVILRTAALMHQDEAGPGGLVVAAVRDGETAVVGVGRTGRGGADRPNGRTVFQIASLTKPFTGTVLADLMRTGRVDAADPLERHLRRPARVPHFGSRPIRLLDLATHTAGLPSVPETRRFSWDRLEDPRNPYKPLTREEVEGWLAGFDLPVPPGTRFRYSNVGMAVLGEALEAAAGHGYGELLERVVTGPLGMRDTVLALSAEQRGRKAVGFARGEPVPDWEAPAMQPSFGLYGTADDLLLWLRANLGDCGGRACPAELAATLALARYVRVDGRSLADPGALGQGGVALGWFAVKALDGTPILWHSGATGGFNAYMAFAPAHGWGVVALTNSDPERVVADRAAREVIRRMEGW